MALTTNQEALIEFAARLKRLCPSLPDTAALPARLLHIRMRFTRGEHELPMHCTESPGKVCGLLKNLDAANDILDCASAEVIEDAPGKVSVRMMDGFKSPKWGNGGVGYENAAILLYCLVAGHRCVDQVQFLFSNNPRRGFELLLCDALTTNTSLTCLHLKNFMMNDEATAAVLAALIRLLPSQLCELSLKNLELSEEACESLDSMAEALATTVSLKTLKIINVTLYGESSPGEDVDLVDVILQALTANSSLFSLTVDASFAAHKDGESLKQMLANPSGPVELTVDCHHSDYRHKAWQAFKALEASTTVKKFSADGFRMNRSSSKAVCDLLGSSKTIQDISYYTHQWLPQTPMQDWVQNQWSHWHADYLLVGLAKTTSLRRLAVNYEFCARAIQRILQAAKDCTPLAELHFPCIKFRKLKSFNEALANTEAEAKVTVGSWKFDGDLTDTIEFFTRSKLRTKGQHGNLGVLRATLRSGGRALALGRALVEHGGDRLTSLRLCDYRSGVDEQLAVALAHYLFSARSLRRLKLSFEMSPSTAHAIIESITQSKSIEKLTIRHLDALDKDLALLFGWLCESRRTYSFRTHVKSLCAHKSAMKSLASSLQASYALTRYEEQDSSHKTIVVPVQNMVRRNKGLLRCAVGFALGVESKRAAGAFELVAWHPLLSAAVQRTGSLSKAEAERRIAQGVRRVRDNFWQLSGIVKEQIVCNERPAGENGGDNHNRPHELDQLPELVLERIRSYLKISDVQGEDDIESPIILDEEDEVSPRNYRSYCPDCRRSGTRRLSYPY